MIREQVRVSALGKTWILDLDGTIVKHNGYLIDGKDSFLDGAKIFLDSIPETDMIIFLTSRTDAEKELTEKFLEENQIRYSQIIYHAPYGERILINDKKASGLVTALSFSPDRNRILSVDFVVDDTL
ncbi:MAG: hypothetical protein PHY47_07405 [Lachnospiraceae bacterium]|nr:hypothetical protein [Lachnospiraceae bacterium]